MSWQFLAEASPGVGYGHLMRIMSLVEVCNKEEAEVVVHIIGASDLGEFDWVSSSRRLTKFIFHSDHLCVDRIAHSTFIIVDGYGFSEEDLAEVRLKADVLARFIDVDSRITSEEDVLITVAPMIKLDVQRGKLPTVHLNGFKYALIRDEILQVRKNRFGGFRSDLVVIAVGGSDSQSLEPLIAKQVLAATSCDVAIPLTSLTSSLVSQIDEGSRKRLRGFRRIEFASVLEDCVVAVVGAGVATLECGCAGVPVVSVVVAGNQSMYASAKEVHEFACVVDGMTDERHRIGDAVCSLLASPTRLRAMAEKGRTTIDGQGATRVIERLRSVERRAR